MVVHRYLPAVVKAGLARHRQRALSVAGWEDFQAPNGRIVTEVAIVGNAGYLMDLDQGGTIDGHSLVVRLNNFRTRGYERHVGGRCDVFMTNFFTDIRFDRPELGGVDRVVASVPNTFRKVRSLRLYHRHAEHITEGMRKLDRQRVYVPSLDTFLDACAACGAVPSTGFMAILFALHHISWSRLFVTGFSFFRGREHYFDDAGAARPRHDFERERLVLARELLPLIRAGRVHTDEAMQADLVEAAG